MPAHCNFPGNVAAYEAARKVHKNNLTGVLALVQGEWRHILGRTSARSCKGTLIKIRNIWYY